MDKKIAGIFVIGFLFFLLVAISIGALFMSQPNLTEGFLSKTYKECDISIREEFWSNPFDPSAKIDNMYCRDTGITCIRPFGIFTAEGTLELSDSNGVIAHKEYETGTLKLLVGFLDGETGVTLRGCTSDTTLTARLYDDGRGLVDTKTFEVI